MRSSIWIVIILWLLLLSLHSCFPRVVFVYVCICFCVQKSNDKQLEWTVQQCTVVQTCSNQIPFYNNIYSYFVFLSNFHDLFFFIRLVSSLNFYSILLHRVKKCFINFSVKKMTQIIHLSFIEHFVIHIRLVHWIVVPFLIREFFKHFLLLYKNRLFFLVKSKPFKWNTFFFSQLQTSSSNGTIVGRKKFNWYRICNYFFLSAQGLAHSFFL